MPAAARLNDKGTEHDGYHETVITAGSPTVLIDGLPAARMGDPLTPHDKPEHPPHPRKIASGSSTVFIDGLPGILQALAEDDAQFDQNDKKYRENTIKSVCKECLKKAQEAAAAFAPRE